MLALACHLSRGRVERAFRRVSVALASAADGQVGDAHHARGLGRRVDVGGQGRDGRGDAVAVLVSPGDVLVGREHDLDVGGSDPVL